MGSYLLIVITNNLDDFVKSRKTPFFVISRIGGESIFFKWLHIVWTPVFTGVTTFYETIIIEPEEMEIQRDPKVSPDPIVVISSCLFLLLLQPDGS